MYSVYNLLDTTSLGKQLGGRKRCMAGGRVGGWSCGREVGWVDRLMGEVGQA